MPTIEELKHLQSQSLERKVRLTQTRIMEFYQKFGGQVYVSFSGGKDSTVLLDLTRRMFPDIEAVFVNTGLEYPEIVEFVKTKENVTIIRPKMSFRDVIDEYGYPIIGKEVSQSVQGARKGQASMIAKLNGTLMDRDGNKSIYCHDKYRFLLDAPFKIDHHCCDVMKKRPFHDFGKKSGKHPIIGTMAHESRLRRGAWVKTGCNILDGKSPQSKPMSFWTEQDVLRYLKETGIPYANVYGEIVPKSEFVGQLAFGEMETSLMTSGVERTGCMFCMFGVHLEKEPNRFQRMKITHPKLYDYCMRDWDDGGLGLREVLDFIKVEY